ncbi:MAG: glycosyltransferase [Pseudomonadota bacterium]
MSLAEPQAATPVPAAMDQGRKLVVFGFDASEAAQRRRIRSYMECGYDVIGLTMRRRNMTHDAAPFWDNLHLGETRNADMGQRLRVIAAAIPKVWRARNRLRGARTIVARNLDMLILGAAAQAMLRPRPRLVYECLDIHGMMTAPGTKGRVARALERGLLARCDAVVVSSPAFVQHYFGPIQGWAGDVRLVENKLWLGPDDPPRPVAADVRARTDGPMVLGWVGTLRCARSLGILSEVARRLGSRVEIRMHGIVHHESLPAFDDLLARRDNLTYRGPYRYPDGLRDIYRDCDAVWAQDLWQWGTNSTWLLPNRIYEAGYYGCPMIAVDGTETGRRVADGLGWTIATPDAEALTALLDRLTPEDLAARRRMLLDMPDETFRQSMEEISASVDRRAA